MTRKLLVVALVIGIALAVGGALLAVGSSSGGDADAAPPPAPGPPTDPTLEVTLCAPPRCTELRLDAELRWSAPTSGGDLTGYWIERNGFIADDDVPPDQTSFVDRNVTLKKALRYRIRASGPGGTSAWVAATAKVPEPPLVAALLDGPYEITLEVTQATNLGRLDGIEDPTPGDRTDLSWTFFVRCDADRACPTSWEGDGTLSPRGPIYEGTFVESEDANCFGGGRVPVDRHIRIKVVEAGFQGIRWMVTRFEGTTTISFVCPGGVASVGTLRVEGRIM